MTLHRRLLSVLVLGLLLVGCAVDVERAARPVIDGEPTPAGLYPATGALVYEFEGQYFPGCTGTLIAPDVVLTAAHCLTSDGPDADIVPGFSLALDANTVTADDVHAGARMAIHPQFDLTADPGLGVGQWFDIGILFLDAPVTGVAHERLPTTGEAAGLTPGMPIELVGYGMTDPDDYQQGGVKHHAMADLIEVGDHELLIAQPGQPQNCYGDSGGPGFAALGGERRLVGIVSRGPDQQERCDHGGIDTRVDAYLDWIDEVAELPDEPLDPGDPADPGGDPNGEEPDPEPEPDPDPADPSDPSNPDPSDDGDPTEGGGCNAAGTSTGTGTWLIALLVALSRRRRWFQTHASSGRILPDADL